MGPEDGRSKSPSYKGLFNAAANVMRSLAYKAEIEGRENLPTEGANVYAANHSSFIDAALLTPLTKQDTRVMATIDLFTNKVTAKLCEAAGVFPVDRLNPSAASIEHAKEVLRDDNGFLIYPEGTFPDECAEGRIGAFKRGMATIAIDGEAESIVPIAVDYQPNPGVEQSAKVKGWMTAAAVTGGGVLASVGGPLSRTFAGAFTGMITGARMGAKFRYDKAENPYFWNPAPKLGAGVIGGVAGGLLGGITGALAASNGQFGTVAALSLSGTAGLSTLAAADWWNSRPVARVKIGKKFSIQNHIDKATKGARERRQAIKKLTEQAHETIGTLKAEISGVPYDSQANRLAKGFPLVTKLKSDRFGNS